MPFQGKFNVIKITVVIDSKIVVNYCSICFIALAPGANVIKLLP
jgi:hypothetical protein